MSLVADVLTAMGLMRVISGQTVNAAFVRQVIDTLVLPAVAALTVLGRVTAAR